MAKSPVVTLRLNPQLRAALQSEADREHRTLSNKIETILFQHFADRGEPIGGKLATGRRPDVAREVA